MSAEKQEQIEIAGMSQETDAAREMLRPSALHRSLPSGRIAAN
jgi:hypothetical protein